MMYLIVPIALIWACVVFPSSRIVVGIIALIGIGLIFVVIQNEKTQQKDNEIKKEQEQATRDQERAACETKKKTSAEADKVNWSVVKASQVELRESLLRPPSYGDEYDLTAS